MRYALLALLFSDCAAVSTGVCLTPKAAAALSAVDDALRADDWLARLERLSHADLDGTDTAVGQAFETDAALAAGGDVDAAKRVQHERQWLALHKRG